ncbi:hypothetical protein HUG10_12400 [Halorarum halophilum]|uniref:Uncharacterized protein n=1 Tax=Halorarum halophilum TaxID=2743090 RepID=A0A7D5KGF6_9EURY|nr:hypothetical protein [Halobaculum halophilum]QLG28296.1 hypothetical protein HUG10_12400 [Halobaculum halophilum]
MVSRTTTIAVALLAFVGGAAAGGVTTAVAIDDPFSEQPESALQSFETTAVGCVDPTEPGRVDRTESTPNDSGSDLTLRENLTVPSPEAGLDARFDRIAPETYLLEVETVPGKSEATCESGRSEARFAANMTLPDEYTLVLLHDGEYVGVNYASSDVAGGSAGAGRSVSGGDAAGGDAAGGNTDDNETVGGSAGDEATGTES